MAKYWQIAAGSNGRDYSEYFLNYGIACADDPKNQMNEIEIGNVIVLKLGMNIIAAGTVVERNRKYRGHKDKLWIRDFDGWDLPSYIYVNWHKLNQPVPAKGLTRSTINRLNEPKLQQTADSIIQNNPPYPFAPEPKGDNPEIQDDEILNFLIEEGLSPSSADKYTNTLSQVKLLANYYYNNCKWELIGEHETRTFLVIPLLLALGWSEQQLKIEMNCSGGRIDVACFSKVYNEKMDIINNNCRLIIETKGFASGLFYAAGQVTKYPDDYHNCKAVIVTNGYCYKVYNRDNGAFSESPVAYLNLLAPRQYYPLDPDNVGGALKAIKWLLPNSLI